jgi:hypothetical protein
MMNLVQVHTWASAPGKQEIITTLMSTPISRIFLILWPAKHPTWVPHRLWPNLHVHLMFVSWPPQPCLHLQPLSPRRSNLNPKALEVRFMQAILMMCLRQCSRKQSLLTRHLSPQQDPTLTNLKIVTWHLSVG